MYISVLAVIMRLLLMKNLSTGQLSINPGEYLGPDENTDTVAEFDNESISPGLEAIYKVPGEDAITVEPIYFSGN